MALSVFDDKTKQPEDADLAKVLKRSFASWNKLKALIASRFTPLSVDRVISRLSLVGKIATV